VKGARALVSTHDLPRAGRVREALREEGFVVELVTPGEDLAERTDAQLLVLTGEPTGAGREAWATAVRNLDLPVIALTAPDGERSGFMVGVAETFGPRAAADEVAMVGRRVVERRRLQRITGIVGETDAMREVLERVVQIAPVASTVLVTGESGTGKELVARGLHALSPRRHGPFIAVNVAAISETLLESELFGHEKGAFTGAIDSRRGLFELAHKGTIFLDEIGEMPLATQTKLLRVLEHREFLRVGGEKPIRVDVRIVAATNQELRGMVATGAFRKDLYYRLNVLHIELPPLRARRDDIPLLAERFIREVARQNDRPFQGITDEAMEILRNHHWPGNVRELRNLVESMVVLSPGGPIRPDDIPDEVRSGRRDLLPVPLPRAGGGAGGGAGDRDDSVRPQLEFVFRTLVELRMDMDELRREFEAYRGEVPALGRGRGELGMLSPGRERGGRNPEREDLRGLDVVDVEHAGGHGGGRDHADYGDPGSPEDGPEGAGGVGPGERHGRGEEGRFPEDGVVLYRSGMTMEEVEREAIAAALREVEGNRRRAAELLGIGERTLYRKIKKFDLEGS
jgi:DNA-binding NtrC family response regulator